MRTAAELLYHLRSSGGKVVLDGDDLDIEAPDEVLTDTVLEKLRERKWELVALLRAEVAERAPDLSGSSAIAPASAGDAAAATKPIRPPVPERAEPGLRAQLLAAAAERGFPSIVLPALGIFAGRDAWARLASRIGGRFLVEVLEEIQGTPVPRPGYRSISPDRTGAAPR